MTELTGPSQEPDINEDNFFDMMTNIRNKEFDQASAKNNSAVLFQSQQDQVTNTMDFFAPSRRNFSVVPKNQEKAKSPEPVLQAKQVSAEPVEQAIAVVAEAIASSELKEEKPETTPTPAQAPKEDKPAPFAPPYEDADFFSMQMEQLRQNSRVSSKPVFPSKMSKEERIANYDSSERFLTDDDETINRNIDTEEVELYMQLPVGKRRAVVDLSDYEQQLSTLGKTQLKTPDVLAVDSSQKAKSQDFQALIDSNEQLYKSIASEWLKKQDEARVQSLEKNVQAEEKQNQQTVISAPIMQDLTCRNFPNASTGVTACCLNGDLILVGTSAGVLYAYDLITQHPYGVHKEDGKEFVDNPITSIDVHQRRPNYVVYGHAKGQIVLIDLQKFTKTIKCIKGHHSKQIVSVKFVDWTAEKPHFMSEEDPNHKCKECADVKKFMFLSVDIEGKLVQNTVEDFKLYFHANDTVFFDPTKEPCQIWQTLAPRMSSAQIPSESKEEDFCELVAAGSAESVAVWFTPEKRRVDVVTWPKPQHYYSENKQKVCKIRQELPILCWGFGSTPTNNWKAFPLLAIAWGPLIQVYVYQAPEEDSNEFFHEGGHYIISSYRPGSPNDTADIFIESMHFIEQGLLFVVASNGEVRVIKTEKLRPEAFKEPEMTGEISWDKIDVRSKLMPNCSELHKLQKQIEVERLQKLPSQLLKSMGGLRGSQTVSVFQSTALVCTNKGLAKMSHLSWQQSLGPQRTDFNAQEWVKTLGKLQRIYLQKMTGFRVQTKVQTNDLIKAMITAQIQKMLLSQIDPYELLTCIRALIDFCVDVKEPQFLFQELLAKFQEHGQHRLLCDELRNYILSSIYSELQIEEKVLGTVLRYYQEIHVESLGKQYQTLPPWMISTRNVERILLEFKYKHCSGAFKADLIEFCRQNHMSTAIIYLCLQTFKFDFENQSSESIYQAFQELKWFYEQASPTAVDLSLLNTLAIESPQRLEIEQSKSFFVQKMLWIARQFLKGSKIPRGKFTTEEWKIASQEIADIFTQDEFMEILTQHDPDTYFSTLLMLFNRQSAVYAFIGEGKHFQQPQVQIVHSSLEPSSRDYDTSSQENSTSSTVTDPYHQPKRVLKHSGLIQRVLDYFLKAGRLHPGYQQFLQFLADSCQDSDNQYKRLVQMQKDFRLDQTVQNRLKSLEHEILSFGQAQMTKDITVTIRLFDGYFKTAHQRVLDSMEEDSKMQMLYILKLLEVKKQEIKEIFTSQGLGSDSSATQMREDERSMWLKVLKQHVRLLCLHAPHAVTSQIKQIVKDNFYPMDECLKIVTHFKQLEAMALLNKKIGNNSEAIRLYILLLKNNLCENDLKRELFYFEKEGLRHRETLRERVRVMNREKFKRAVDEDMNGDEQSKICLTMLQTCMQNMFYHMAHFSVSPDLRRVWAEKHGPNMELMENTQSKVVKILQKNYQECLLNNKDIWREYLEILFNIRFHPAMNRKHFCKVYIRDKITEFCLTIVQYIPFTQIMDTIQSFRTVLRLKAIRELVHVVFTDKTNEDEMCIQAAKNQDRDLRVLLGESLKTDVLGILFEEASLKCGLCHGPIQSLNKNLFKDKYFIFNCAKHDREQFDPEKHNHCFHQRCLRVFFEAELDREKQKKNKLTDEEFTQLMRCPVCYPKGQLNFSEQKTATNKGTQLEKMKSIAEYSGVQGGIKTEEKAKLRQLKAMSDFDKILPSATCNRHNFTQPTSEI